MFDLNLVIYNSGLLLRCYTQNIDGLERQAGISDEKLVEAHGTFNTGSCIKCKRPVKIGDLKQGIQKSLLSLCGLD